MPKTNIKIDTTKCRKIYLTFKNSQITPKSGLTDLTDGANQEASGKPLDPKIIKASFKNLMFVLLFCMHLCICFSICGLAHRAHGESHCNYCRLDLYLPSLVLAKMLTQCQQIAWGSCLGERRWPAAGVFDNWIHLDDACMIQTRPHI